MFRLQPEGKMFYVHAASVTGRSAGSTRPELSDDRQMRRPVVNPLIKYGSDNLVLSDVGIKLVQQLLQSITSSDPVIECIHLLPEELDRFVERFGQFGWILAASARVVRLAAAFAADDGGDGLNDFAGLNFRGELRADARDQ